MYAADSWTLKVGMMNQLEALELWCYRMLRITLTARTMMVEVLRKMRCEQQLLLCSRKVGKTSYLSHLLRNDKYTQLITEGKLEEKQRLGCKKLS